MADGSARPVGRPIRRPVVPLVLVAGLATAVLGTPARASTLRADPGPLARATWTIAADSRDILLAQAADPAAPPANADAPPSPAPVDKGPSPVSAALRSLVVPGWGQLATGHKTQAATFFTLEAASWASYITFQRQGKLRRDAYFETAQIYAGIALEGQDEDIRRLVGQYQSNDVYNQYVVRREAAFFIDDPAEQQAYIAEHSLGGAETWAWTDFDDFLRYREQRRSSEAAYHNSEFVLGFALANRLVSAAMAAKQASSARKKAAAAAGSGAAIPEPPSPVPGRPDGRLAWGVSPSMNGPLEGRIGWVVTF
jgi:hypothetical protein